MLNTKKLFTKVLSKLTDSGWKTDIPYVAYRKKNGMVLVSCYTAGNKTINTSYQTLGTLPSGYRPSTTLYTTAGTNSVNCGAAYVSSNGDIGVKTFTSTTAYFWFQMSFPVTD